MSSKSGMTKTNATSKSGKSGPAENNPNSPLDDDDNDIFMDKGELLKEKLDKMDASIVIVSKQIKKLTSYNNWLDLALEDRVLQNNELENFVQKKESQKSNHSTTLSDFHRYNIEVLKQERQQMLEEFSQKQKVLRERLHEEQKTLDRYREELSKRDELKSIKLKQETEIDQLEKQARLLRTDFSQKINQLKEELQKSTEQLEREGKQQLKQISTDAQRQSVRLVIEKMQDTQYENHKLRDDIWQTKQNIQLLEKHLEQLIGQYKELRREKLQGTDFEYIRKRRQQGLLEIGQ